MEIKVGNWYIRTEDPSQLGILKIGEKYKLIEITRDSKYSSGGNGIFEDEDGNVMMVTPSQRYRANFSCFTLLSEDQPPKNFNNPLAALRDVLPDVYGRKEHLIFLEKQKADKIIEEESSFWKTLEAFDKLMDNLCGPSITDELPIGEPIRK